MSFYPLVVVILAWLTATSAALGPARVTRPAALFVAMHVTAVGAVTVLIATQALHWGALVLPLATLRSIFGIANDWASDDESATRRVRSTAIKVPLVSGIWIAGWAIAGLA